MSTPIADSARRQMELALSTVPVDKHGAIVAYANEEGQGIVMAVRAGDHWTFEAHVVHDSSELEYGAAVRFAW